MLHEATRDAIASNGRDHLDVVETKLNSISFRIPYHFVEQAMARSNSKLLEIFSRIKFSEPRKDIISEVLDLLETNKTKLEIDSYGIRDSSLEEIFIKIANQEKAI